MKPVEVNVKFLYHFLYIMYLRGTNGNIDPKWVKQQQYRREWHNLMLLA